MKLLRAGQLQRQAFHRDDAALALGVQQQLPVGAVVQEEGLPGHAAAEVVGQQREHPVLWLDLAAQDAVVIGKTHEAPEFFQFTAQVTQGTGDGIVHIVGLAAHKAGPLVVQLADEGVQAKLLVLQTGQPGPAQDLQSRRGQALQTVVNPLAMVPAGNHHPHRIQGDAFLIAVKGDGEFFMGIAVEHTAQEAGEAAVILKDHILHGVTRHRTATAADILGAAAGPAPWPPAGGTGWRQRSEAPGAYGRRR